MHMNMMMNMMMLITDLDFKVTTFSTSNNSKIVQDRSIVTVAAFNPGLKAHRCSTLNISDMIQNRHTIRMLIQCNHTKKQANFLDLA